MTRPPTQAMPSKRMSCQRTLGAKRTDAEQPKDRVSAEGGERDHGHCHQKREAQAAPTAAPDVGGFLVWRQLPRRLIGHRTGRTRTAR
jgi:hypothetical protein